MLTVIYRILLLYLSLSLVHDAIGFDECTPHPPCMCEYDDGRIIDLRPLANEDFINGTKGNLTFYYHPCANKNLTIPDVNVTQSCAGGTSVGIVTYMQYVVVTIFFLVVRVRFWQETRYEFW